MSAAEEVDVDVVVPTWNGRELLERCLRSLARQTARHRAIVVDNGSTDGTAALVRESYPSTTLVSLPENRGFAIAVNAGIRAGGSKYVVLVNNDVECDPAFVANLRARLRGDPRVGAVAGLLLGADRTHIDSFGLELDRTLSAFPRFAGSPYSQTELDDRHLVGPSGGAAGYRRDAITNLGLFDERLFAYMEDVDLALRLRAAGWKAAGAPDAVGVHLGSATFGRRSRWQVEVSGASRAYMLRKYGVLRRTPGVALWALAMEAGVVCADAIQRRDLAALRGRLRGWRAAARITETLPRDAINEAIRPRESLSRRRDAVRG